MRFDMVLILLAVRIESILDTDCPAGTEVIPMMSTASTLETSVHSDMSIIRHQVRTRDGEEQEQPENFVKILRKIEKTKTKPCILLFYNTENTKMQCGTL
jgi:hypothetical protein